MDRRSDRQTQTRSDSWERVLDGRWADKPGQDQGPVDGGERPTRPLLDRLTQVGGGRWIPPAGTGGGRQS